MAEFDRRLLDAPDFAITRSQGRSLLKRAGSSDGVRQRTVPNIYATLADSPQPRRGFLSVEMMRTVYIKSEIVRGCVDTLIELVAGVPWTIRPKDEDRSKWLKKRRPDEYLDQRHRITWAKKFFGRPSQQEDLEHFHRKTLRDLLIFDAGTYEVVSAVSGGRRLPLELASVAGETIEIQTDRQGVTQRYWQSYNVVQRVEFEFDELAYMQLNPCNWSPYGISPIETAIVSICSDLNANNHNSDYFSKNGIPPALLAVLGVSEAEFRRITASLKNAASDNPHNIHPFRGQRSPDGKAQDIFQLVPLSQISNREMQFKELLTFCINRICMLYKVTPSQIGFTEGVTGGLGSGVAETQRDSQQNKGVAPLLRRLEKTHTHRVLDLTCGWDDLEYAFVESHTPQEDADYARDSGEVNNGTQTINEFRSKWGGRSPLEWGDDAMVLPQGYQAKQQQQQGMMGGGMPDDGGGGIPDDGGIPQASGQPGQQPGQPGQQPPQLQKSAEKRIIIRI